MSMLIWLLIVYLVHFDFVMAVTVAQYKKQTHKGTKKNKFKRFLINLPTSPHLHCSPLATKANVHETKRT